MNTPDQIPMETPCTGSATHHTYMKKCGTPSSTDIDSLSHVRCANMRCIHNQYRYGSFDIVCNCKRVFIDQDGKCTNFILSPVVKREEDRKTPEPTPEMNAETEVETVFRKELVLAKVEEAGHKDKNKCPHGFVWGKDCDNSPKCEKCELWEDCASAQNDIKEKKKDKMNE